MCGSCNLSKTFARHGVLVVTLTRRWSVTALRSRNPTMLVGSPGGRHPSPERGKGSRGMHCVAPSAAAYTCAAGSVRLDGKGYLVWPCIVRGGCMHVRDATGDQVPVRGVVYVHCL